MNARTPNAGPAETAARAPRRARLRRGVFVRLSETLVRVVRPSRTRCTGAIAETIFLSVRTTDAVRTYEPGSTASFQAPEREAVAAPPIVPSGTWIARTYARPSAADGSLPLRVPVAAAAGGAKMKTQAASDAGASRRMP